MKLSCDEATTICDKSQYGEASLWEKIKLNWHLLLCKKCGRYTKQNQIMTKCYQFNAKKEAHKNDTLTKTEKEEMDTKIKEVI